MENWENERWYVSRFNYVPEIMKERNIVNNLLIADCTLRDGEQQAGVVFNSKEKLTIAKQLDKIGVGEIEIGTPAVSLEDEEAARMIVQAGLKAKPTALVRALQEDIDRVWNIGIKHITVSLPIGTLQRKYKMKWSDQEFFDRCFNVTNYAKEKGMFVNLSPYDNTRVEIEFLLRLLSEIKERGLADRVRLVDTVGAALPAAIMYLVRQMKSVLKEIPIEVHCHDDFGLAVANTLAAAEAGAEILSTTINGIGERSGNAAFEEVVVALRVLYDIDLGIKYEYLKETSDLVAEISNVTLQNHKAVVGRTSFSHESGMVVAGLLKMPFTAEPYSPEFVGQVRSILIGKKTGLHSLDVKLQEMGIPLTKEKKVNMLSKVKQLAINEKRALTDKEIRDLAENL